MQIDAFQRALDDLWQDMSRNGWVEPQSLATVVAQMIAMAQAPVGLESRHELLSGGGHELTADAWSHMTRDFMRLDSRFEKVALSADGLERALPPGTLERVRRHLFALGALQPGMPAPWWCLRAILDLARSRTPAIPFLSQESVLLICACVDVRPGDHVYCGYSGAAEIGLALAAEHQVSVDAEIREPGLAALYLWLSAAGRLEINVEVSDPLERLARDQMSADIRAYDLAIVNGPFGERRDRIYTDNLWREFGLVPSGNLDGLYLMLAAQRSRRAAACITINGFLFRTTVADQSVKEQAIRRYGLDTVVSLPRGAFGRHVSVPGSVLLFRSRREGTALDGAQGVLMMDARREADRAGDATWVQRTARLVHTGSESDTSVMVPVDDIIAQDFNITVERYVLTADARRARAQLAAASVPLDDIAELYRPQALLLGRDRGNDPAPPSHQDAAEMLFEVGVADIDEAGIVRRPAKQVQAADEVIQRARKAKLAAGDVLLVIKGSAGKVGYVRDIPEGETWLASQSFVVLKLRRHGPIRDPRVLFRFLSSPLGQGTIQSLKGGTIPGLQMNDVRRLPILVLPMEVQAVVAEDVGELFGVQDRIEELRDDLELRQRTIWPDLDGDF